MKKYSSLLFVIFILIGCDVAKDSTDEKTMQGYLACMEKNKEEVSLFGFTFVRDECANKHSKESFFSPFANCKATITVGGSPEINLTTCENDANSIITALKVGISVENIPELDTITILSQHKNIFIKPNQNIEVSIPFSSSALKDYTNLPFCNDISNENRICKSWFINDFKYIPAKIK